MRMGRLYLGALIALSPAMARAEKGERAVVLEGGAIVPALEAQDGTALGLISLLGGLVGRYGLTDNLDVEARFDMSVFAGRRAEVQTWFGQDLEGTRWFQAVQYHVGLGGRYKLWPGYFVAPYAEAQVGGLWLVVRDQAFLNNENQDYGLELDDEGQGALTLTAGVGIDVRLGDGVMVGVAVRWVELVGPTLYRRYLSVPLQGAIYW